jgi:transposase
VGEDRTEEAVRKFFTEEMGCRRCRTLQVVCMDMWAAYAKLVREHAANAQILFDRFHILKHLNEAVDEARRQLWRRLSRQERVDFKGTRWLLLKNPWNLNDHQQERLSTLVRWNTPLVRAWYLKESFQLFWTYQQPWRAKQHLLKWMNSAMRSKLEPFKTFVRMLRSHLDGVLAWTKTRLSNGAVEGMNNKIQSISHRSFGFRSASHFIAAIYHCCALALAESDPPMLSKNGSEQEFDEVRNWRGFQDLDLPAAVRGLATGGVSAADGSGRAGPSPGHRPVSRL